MNSKFTNRQDVLYIYSTRYAYSNIVVFYGKIVLFGNLFKNTL